MKIFYWSPFLSNIATVDAVAKSIKSILTYDKNKKFKPSIIDVTGENPKEVAIPLLDKKSKDMTPKLFRGN